jgi:hypothetical protein
VLLIKIYKIDKTIHQLIHETEDIIREDRMKRESQLKEKVDQVKSRESESSEEIQELKTAKSSNEKKKSKDCIG